MLEEVCRRTFFGEQKNEMEVKGQRGERLLCFVIRLEERGVFIHVASELCSVRKYRVIRSNCSNSVIYLIIHAGYQTVERP